jgi:hypothetical protein
MLLKHSNGELGDGSSNKTPHMVVPIPLAPLVAHRLQLLHVIRVKGKEGRENARAIKLYCGVAEDTRGVWIVWAYIVRGTARTAACYI